jgi:hypothetical protein
MIIKKRPPVLTADAIAAIKIVSQFTLYDKSPDSNYPVRIAGRWRTFLALITNSKTRTFVGESPSKKRFYIETVRVVKPKELFGGAVYITRFRFTRLK